MRYDGHIFKLPNSKSYASCRAISHSRYRLEIYTDSQLKEINEDDIMFWYEGSKQKCTEFVDDYRKTKESEDHGYLPPTGAFKEYWEVA